MKSLLLLLILSLALFNSCSKNTKTDQEIYLFKVISSNNDSLIYDNSNLQFEVNLDESTAKRFENDSLYYECYQYHPTEGNNKYNVQMLKRKNKNKLIGNCFVQKGVGSISYKIYSKNSALPFKYQFDNLIVISKNNTSNRGSYDNSLFTDNKKIYFAYFYESLKFHPEYIDIYFNKWNAGYPMKFISKDTIRKDLDFLIKNHSDNPNISLFKYIGYYILRDSLNAVKEYPNLIKMKSNIFNNWSVVVFMEILKTLPITNQNLHNEICDSIAVHNFNSHFLYSVIKSGHDLVSIPTKIKAIKKYLQVNEDPYFDMALINLWSQDKKQLNEKEIAYYFDRVKKYAIDTNLFIKGINKRMTCNTFKIGTLERMARHEIRNHKEKELLDYIAQYNEIFKNDTKNQTAFILNEQKFLIQKQYDSAAYFAIASSSSIGFPLDVFKIIKYHKQSRSSDSFEEWSKKIRAKCFADIRTNAKKVPENLYSANYTNKQINMNINRLKVIEYFSVICSPCIENIKNIEKYRKENPNSKIDFIFISADEKKESEEFLRKIGVKDEIPSNSGEFVRLLGIDNFPTTIFIDKNNNIVRNENGGGASSFTQSLKEFEENYK